jgi:pimeloyl-ACP methyl ester carboxylesterase
MGGGSHAVELDQGAIAYEQAGDGPPLLLLHGAYADSRDWAPQLETLAADFTVVAWDAPGCGGSFDPPPDFGLDGYADCVHDLTDALGLERPHLAGLSFGSGLALEVFRRDPGLPRSLILASAYAGWAGSLGREAAEERRAQFLRDADRPIEDVVPDFSTTLFDEGASEEVVASVAELMLETRPAGIRAMANAFADADLRDVLPKIDIPTLLIYGEADQRSPVSIGRELHAAIPGSRLVVLPGIGHLVNFEAPERFDEEVRSFLMA